MNWINAANFALLVFITVSMGLWTRNGRKACERKIREMQDEIDRLTKRLGDYASCPCPRLAQVEELALAEMKKGRERFKKNLELEQALGRAVLAGMPDMPEDEPENA